MTYYWTNPMQQMNPGIPVAPSYPNTGAFREESYIENILRLNRGRPGVFHFSFNNTGAESNNKSVRGVVEAAGRDHVILSEAKSNHRYLFPMIYFDYAEFDEDVAYFPQTP